MIKTQISHFKWNISNNLEITKSKQFSISKEEQECLFLIEKLPFNMPLKDLKVDCSYQKYITKLSKSSLFTLEKILVSIHPDHTDFILAISGTMPKNGISIRKTQRYATNTNCTFKKKVELMGE